MVPFLVRGLGPSVELLLIRYIGRSPCRWSKIPSARRSEHVTNSDGPPGKTILLANTTRLFIVVKPFALVSHTFLVFRSRRLVLEIVSS